MTPIPESMPRVMVVDDEVENTEFLGRALRSRFEVHAATNGAEALELVAQHVFAVIISDQRMPGMTGVEFLAKVLELAPNTVRIILTGYSDLDDTIDAINLCRVTSFLRKPIKPIEIQQAVESAAELYTLRTKNLNLIRELEQRQDQLEEKEKLLQMDLDEKSKTLLKTNARLEEMVVRDGLTGLYNHRYFQERTQQEIQRAKRYTFDLSLTFFDLDHFKEFNDVNGHPAGDEALKGIASLLRHEVRASDVVARLRGSDVIARYGGEEFVALLPQTPKSGAMIVAERLRSAVEQFHFVGEENTANGCLTVSVGVATFPHDATDRQTLIETADEALYRAKAAGRNRLCAWEPSKSKTSSPKT